MCRDNTQLRFFDVMTTNFVQTKRSRPVHRQNKGRIKKKHDTALGKSEIKKGNAKTQST
jgi:hypothetical protein